jgi:hypothetical protein
MRGPAPAAGAAREAAEDVFFGQVVMIWARWAVIAVAAILFLWSAGDVGQLTGRVVLLVCLMAVNFFLHGRLLVERPANRALILLATLADLALIDAGVLVWGGGLRSQLYVLLYPVLLAFALVFPPRLTALVTTLAIAAYAGTIALAGPAWLGDVQEVKEVFVRLLTLAAMGGLGTYYWRIQRRRRRAAVAAALGR